MELHKSNKQKSAYFLALSLIVQDVLAERDKAETEKSKLSQEMDSHFKYFPILGVGIILLAYLVYNSYLNNAGSLIEINKKGKEWERSLPKKKKKKTYLREDNEAFFKELDKEGPYPESEGKEG